MSYTATINVLCVVIVVEAMTLALLAALLTMAIWALHDEAQRRLAAIMPAWMQRRIDNG